MSKKARAHRARARIDRRLEDGREKKYDLLLWQFPEWDTARLRSLDKFEKSRENMFADVNDISYFIFFYEQRIHKGRKP